MAFAGPTSTLIDRFDQQTLDTSKWVAANPAQISELGVLIISNVISNTSYGVVNSVNTFDFTGSSIFSQLVDAGNQSLASWQAQPVYISIDASNGVNWYVNAGLIHAQKLVAGAFTDVLATTSYNAAIHKWFRIRHSGSTIFWDFSTDGRTWTNYTTLANPFGSITAVVPTVQAGTYNPEVSGTSMKVANFNFTATMKPINSGLRPHPFSPGLAR
jgi:hypothetical protein